MNNKLAEFIARIEELRPELITRFHVSQLSLFGSYVRDEQTPESDLDILVSFSEMPSLFEFINLQIFLSDSLNIKVDLNIQEDLNPFLSKHVLKEKIKIV